MVRVHELPNPEPNESAKHSCTRAKEDYHGESRPVEVPLDRLVARPSRRSVEWLNCDPSKCGVDNYDKVPWPDWPGSDPTTTTTCRV